MITPAEVEMLAALLARAGVTPIEAAWANGMLNKLRALAKATERGKKLQEEETDAEKLAGES